jgi:hypothetical protein
MDDRERDDVERAELEPLRRAVVEALRAAAESRSWRSPALEEGVRRYARAARAGGVAPERFLVALKRTVREEALPETSEWFRDVVLGRVVLWGIDAYYDLGR